MSNIIKHEGGNIGGMCPVYWAFASDISGITIDKQTLICTIALATGKKWNILYGTPDSIEMDSEETEKPAGTQYAYKVKMLIPQDRSSVETKLRQMSGRGIILHTTDKNGIVRIFGTPENPVKKVSKLKKPANVDGYNGWEVTFNGDFSLPALYGNALDTGDISTE